MADLRRRYRILDFDRVLEKLEARDIQEVREACCGLIERRVKRRRFARETRWSEPVAVGSERFVRQVAGRLGRRRLEVAPVEEGNENTWHVQEVSPRYRRF